MMMVMMINGWIMILKILGIKSRERKKRRSLSRIDYKLLRAGHDHSWRRKISGWRIEFSRF